MSLLGLKFEDLSWDFAKPSQEDNPDCLPCIFIQFRVVENGMRVTKILQIFSKQVRAFNLSFTLSCLTLVVNRETPHDRKFVNIKRVVL